MQKEKVKKKTNLCKIYQYLKLQWVNFSQGVWRKQANGSHSVIIVLYHNYSFPNKFDPCFCDLRINKGHTLLMEFLCTNFELIVDWTTNLETDWCETLWPLCRQGHKNCIQIIKMICNFFLYKCNCCTCISLHVYSNIFFVFDSAWH